MRYCKKLLAICLAVAMIFTVVGVAPVSAEAANSLKTTSISSAKETAGTTVSIKWEKVGSSKGYIVYRKTGKNGKYKKLTTIKKYSTVMYVDKTTKANTTYYYAIMTYKGNKKSVLSNAKGIKTSGNPVMGTFYCDATTVLENQNQNITFTVQVNNYNRVKSNSIALYGKNSTVVGYLNDNGKNGDEKKNDGIFSLTIDVSGSNGEKQEYYAKLGSKNSNSLDIYFFDNVTEDDVDIYETTSQVLETVNTDLIINGYVDDKNVEELISEVYKQAQILLNDGTAIEVYRGDTSVEVLYSSGIHYIYEAPMENKDAGGSATAMSILTFQPAISQYENDGRDDETLELDSLCTDGIAKSITSDTDFANYTWTYNLDNENVSLNSVKVFSDNQIIIWHGHGLEPSEVNGKVYVVTGDKANALEELNAFITRGICTVNGGYLAFNSSYMAEHVSSMNNSMIYFATCYSAEDSSWGNFFISKGASTYVGNINSIYTKYNCHIMQTVFQKMLVFNKETGYRYTVGEALSYAKAIYGNNDGSKVNAGYTSIYGDKNYRLLDDSNATLSLSESSLSIKNGKSSTIVAKTNISTSNLIWKSSDTSVAAISISNDGATITITGKKAGTATISCTAGSIINKCKIMVKNDNVITKLSTGEYDTWWTNTHEKTFSYGNGTNYPASYIVKISDGNLVVEGALATWNSSGEMNSKFKEYTTYKIPIASNCRLNYADESLSTFTGISRIKSHVNHWFNASVYEGVTFGSLRLAFYVQGGKVTGITLFP